MVFVGEFHDFANFLLHAGHDFDLAGVGKCFRGRIVIAFRHHDPCAHAVDPSPDELLFHVVVAFGSLTFEGHLFLFTVRAGHLHFSGHIHNDVASVHNRFSNGGAF